MTRREDSCWGEIMNDGTKDPVEAQPKPRYAWPWLLLAFVILGILLAILWMSSEIARTRRLRDLNSPPAATPAHSETTN